MNTYKNILCITVLGLVLASTGQAQSSLSEHTLKLDDPANSPPASIESMSWLEGHWKGEAMGGISEEVWSPPAGGAIMGVYRFIKEDEVVFYEIVTILEENNTLMLRLRHFNPDLTGWEEKGETVDFPLVKLENDTAYFDGFTIQRLDGDRMVIYVMVGTPENIREEAFRYDRVK